MKFKSDRTGARLARVLLLVLLVAAQGVAAAHEVIHWDQPSRELCRTCSLSSGVDALATVEAGLVEHVPAPVHFVRHITAGVRLEVSLAYSQRAPPVSL